MSLSQTSQSPRRSCHSSEGRLRWIFCSCTHFQASSTFSQWFTLCWTLDACKTRAGLQDSWKVGRWKHGTNCDLNYKNKTYTWPCKSPKLWTLARIRNSEILRTADLCSWLLGVCSNLRMSSHLSGTISRHRPLWSLLKLQSLILWISDFLSICLFDKGGFQTFDYFY